MKNILLTQFYNISFVLIGFIFMIIAKIIADIRTRDIDDDYEIVENSNPAVSLRRAGLYLSIGIALSGILSGRTGVYSHDLKLFLIEGVLILAILFITRIMNDKLILRGLSNDQLSKEGVGAVGIAELGTYIASGLILRGAFSSSGYTLIDEILSATVFGILGQIVLIVLIYLYQKITPFNILKEIKEDNMAAATSLMGLSISQGVILSAGASKNFISWQENLLSFGFYSIVGIVLLIISKKGMEILFLPKSDLAIEVQRDRNLPALIMISSLWISLSILIAVILG